MVQLATFVAIAVILACQGPPSPGPDAKAQAALAPGALAMSSSEAQVEAVLGQPSKRWVEHDFQWRRYQRGTTIVEGGFYRDKLGRVSVLPRLPLAWPEAVRWLRALAPSFDEAKLNKAMPDVWGYFTQILVDGAPFEVGLQIQRRDGRVTAIHGELNWLD
jgi:hypothetical protein